MPCLIKCSVCGFKFFNDREEVTSPMDMVRRYSFRCPSCFKRLNFNFRNIIIDLAVSSTANRRISLNNEIRLRKDIVIAPDRTSK